MINTCPSSNMCTVPGAVPGLTGAAACADSAGAPAQREGAQVAHCPPPQGPADAPSPCARPSNMAAVGSARSYSGCCPSCCQPGTQKTVPVGVCSITRASVWTVHLQGRPFSRSNSLALKTTRKAPRAQEETQLTLLNARLSSWFPVIGKRGMVSGDAGGK